MEQPTTTRNNNSIAHPNSQNITSALAIDSSGMSLGQIGSSSSTTPLHPSSSGAYSSICKLASQLSRRDNDGAQVATVIIEGEREATLIKEYHGMAVVFKVPVVGKENVGVVSVGAS
jgi:hypothetical protein